MFGLINRALKYSILCRFQTSRIRVVVHDFTDWKTVLFCRGAAVNRSLNTLGGIGQKLRAIPNLWAFFNCFTICWNPLGSRLRVDFMLSGKSGYWLRNAWFVLYKDSLLALLLPSEVHNYVIKAVDPYWCRREIIN